MVSVRTASHRLIFRGPPLTDADYADQLAAADPLSDTFVLYDLRRDPDEQTDVHRSQPEVTATLQRRLVDWRRKLRTGDFVLPQDQVSPEAAEAMRRHGYWDATASGNDSKSQRQEGGAGTSIEVPKPVRPMDDVDAYCGERWLFLDGDPP